MRASETHVIREAFQIHKDDFGHITLHQQALAWEFEATPSSRVIQRPFNDVDLRYVIMNDPHQQQ